MEREPAGPASPERELERAEIGRLVDRAIQALPAELRLAIVLKEYAGCSYLDIAAAAGCPVGTVRSRLFAARQQLRRSLAFLLDE